MSLRLEAVTLPVTSVGANEPPGALYFDAGGPLPVSTVTLAFGDNDGWVQAEVAAARSLEGPWIPVARRALIYALSFEGREFTSDALEVREGTFVLRQELDGPYFQPLTKDQIADGEHVKMAPNGTLATNSRALRARSNVQTLRAVVTVTGRDATLLLLGPGIAAVAARYRRRRQIS